MFTVTNSKRHTIEQNIFVWRKPLYEVSLTFVTPAQNVKQNRNYLDAAIESFQVLDPQSPTGGVAERRFGVHVTPVNSGLRVTSLVNGGFAESIGLMQGDIILSINGRHLTTQTDIDRFRDSLPVGSAVEFEVYRGSNDDFFPPVRRRLAGRF
jgi:S1-C subfamily serine protease